MSVAALVQYASFLLIVGLMVKPVGTYLACVFSGQKTLLDPILRPVETVLYRLFGVPPDDDMSWTEYATAFVAFSLVGTLLLHGMLRLQNFLPGGPDPKFLTTPLTPELAMNTAISFSTTAAFSTSTARIPTSARRRSPT